VDGPAADGAGRELVAADGLLLRSDGEESVVPGLHAAVKAAAAAARRTARRESGT
jgi:hypothetical protein